MPERSFADFRYEDRQEVGFYGEVFRGRSATEDEVRLLEVDGRFAQHTLFASALARFGPQLAALEHRNVVVTRSVGRAKRGPLIVVTEAVRGPLSLEDVLTQAPGHKLPPEIALGIGLDLVEALSVAHERGIVHGALHPRSVLIDWSGQVKLDHFAVGRALAEAAAKDPEAGLLSGAAGYVAPELALGDPPSPASDVYATGALLYVMLTGQTPPGTLGFSPALEKAVQWALDTDEQRRYRDASELAGALVEALEDERWSRATAADIAAHVNDARSDAEAHLDAATEDLLAELEAPAPPGEPAGEWDADEPTESRGATDLDHATDDGLGELVDQPTVVDDDPHQRRVRDPISELIELDRKDRELRLDSSEDDYTPLPPPEVEGPGTLTREGVDVLGKGKHRAHEAEAAAVAAIDSLDEDDEPPPARRPPSHTAVVTQASGARGTAWVWALTTLVLVGVLGFVLYTQTDVFHPERKRAKHEARLAEMEAERRRLEALQPTPGTIELRAQPEGAAVWLLLGRTPVETMPLPASTIHDIRLEHEGYVPLDLRVTGEAWTGDRAEVTGTLEGGEREVRAFPKAPESMQTGASGRGPVRITSTPAGAQAWLLVGFSPEMRLQGIRAGAPYELKVVKEGYRPAFVVIEATDWHPGGDLDAGLADTVSRSVELAPR
jgi:serine/threonine protein kinase